MRPFTRTVPKPLLPVLEKPVIQYVVEEAVEAGISEIVFVVGSDETILRHFTAGPPIDGLEHVTFKSVLQPEPKGLGDAVGRSRQLVNGRRFAVLLSDMFPVPGTSHLGAMTNVASDNVVAVQIVADEVLDRWGIVEPVAQGDTFRLAGAVEKPGKDLAKSNLGLVGRYIFSSDLFGVFDNLEPGWGGEVQLTDAIDVLAKRGEVMGLIVEHPLLDTGIPLGLAKATVEVGLSRPDIKEAFALFLKELGYLNQV